MLKFKPGNVFHKINNMDRKQAYTIGGIVIVCFVALITLASFMGKADDASFDGFDSRGYDLAEMPFESDAAEQYLLSAAYPDMQGNNASVLYSPEEKAARQEEDALEAEEGADDEIAPYPGRRVRGDSDDSNGSGSSRRRGYTGGSRGNGGGTTVGKLNSVTAPQGGGGGTISTTFGPRGDFSTYQRPDKGKETPVQFKNSDAKKALYQFQRGSQAAAGLRDAKGVNAKKALMGGNIAGSEAFKDGAVDLSKTGGLAMDTNAPVTSSDLSHLADDVAQAADQAEKEDEEEQQSFWEKLGEAAMEGLLNVAIQGIGNMVDAGIDAMADNWAGKREGREYVASCMANCTSSPECTGTCNNLVSAGLGSWDATGESHNHSFTPNRGVTARTAANSLHNSGNDYGYTHSYNQGYNHHSNSNNTNTGSTQNCNGHWEIENGKPVCKS